jgi:hypothetical protein
MLFLQLDNGDTFQFMLTQTGSSYDDEAFVTVECKLRSDNNEWPNNQWWQLVHFEIRDGKIAAVTPTPVPAELFHRTDEAHGVEVKELE